MESRNNISKAEETELLEGLAGEDLLNAQVALSNCDWIGFFRLIPAGERLIRFSILMEHLTDVEYYRTLGWVWVNGEKHRLQHFAIRDMLSARSLAARTEMMEPDERQIFDALPPRVNVFRGQVDEESLHGWSWSLDKEKARGFTYGDGFIRSGTCDASKIVAFKHGPENEAMKEDEIIIDPDDVGPLDEEYHAPIPPPDGVTSLHGMPLPGFGNDDLPPIRKGPGGS